MILQRIYDDELAQAAYLLGCESTREAIVVDPSLDLDRYLEAARAENLRLTHVTETHIHADFVSGSRALAAATGATLHLPGEGGPDWSYAEATTGNAPPAGEARDPGHAAAIRFLRDGDTIDVGTVRLTALHTPGHTPEHVAFLVTDTAVSPEPVGMLSGDFIFVGDVGRPDLLERAAHVAGTMEPSARQLFASLRRVRTLPDGLQIWPGHGAGSACGKALGAMPQSTLGYERVANRALTITDENEFVREILSAQPEPPRYFARMKRVNRDGLAASPPHDPPRLDARGVDAAMRDGALVLDTRPSAAFVRQHVPGSICVPRSRSFTTYLGAAAPEECAVVLLVAAAGDVPALRLHLHLVGFDRVVGWAVTADVLAERSSLGLPVGSLELTTVDAVSDGPAAAATPMLLDVRSAGERQEGVIPGVTEVALSQLDEWARAHPQTRPVVIHCGTGSRAIIGASILRARGYDVVQPLAGGYKAWVAAGHPVSIPTST